MQKRAAYRRRRANGWFPPSLRSRVENILSWASRYRRLAPIAFSEVETARFDTQAHQTDPGDLWCGVPAWPAVRL
ncbi:MAG: RRXRR domain-containing protein [Thermogemmatispora sp.]|nr:RRXRR domain-containing protein [Thermogemmatispora sp.]